MKRFLVVVLLILFLMPCKGQQKTAAKFKNTNLDFETRAKDLVNQLTLDEKISQLGDSSPAIPRLGIPEYNWWNEGLHGVARSGIATMFPQAIGMAASFNTVLMKQVANVISDEARAKYHDAIKHGNHKRYYGLTYWSPNINIFRDPRWGRGQETYGEDPYLTGQMGIQFVKGLQGNHSKYFKLIATPKHFAVHNGPELKRHYFNVTPSARDLWETYLPAFKDLIVDAKAYSIMGAYNRVNGESASASSFLLDDILRKKWGFKGYVVSDCGAIKDIHAYHKIVNTPKESATLGIKKGCDLNCGSIYQKHLKTALSQSLINEKEIDLSLYRLILAKMKLGMFDPDNLVPYTNIPISINASKAHDKMALKMAHESMTLLKNNGILPLKTNTITNVAVVGPNANNIKALRGNYFGKAANPVTVISGLKKALGSQINVTYSAGVPMVTTENSSNNKLKPIYGKYLSTTNTYGQEVTGLTGYYYNNKDLQGKPSYTRVDNAIRFTWSNHTSPTSTEEAQGIIDTNSAIKDNNFSVQWHGKLLPPETGLYKIVVSADDGCRLWINGELIINDWSNHAMTSFSKNIHLKKGEYYDIKVDYYDSTGDAAINLKWEIPNSIKTEPITEKLTAKTLKNVKQADVALFIGGLDASWEGEEMKGKKVDGFVGGDRTKIELPQLQVNAIKAMIKTGTPVVLVLMSGSAMAFKGLEKDLAAILMAWYPGQRGGDAVANVLLGNYNPAGRLPVTFYTSTKELASFEDYNMQAGKGFTYRYYKGKALYPFGYGLSYTTFKYSKLNVNKINNSNIISVSVDIKNTGNTPGDEVVQLYIKDLKSNLAMPIKQLRKFKRLFLKPNETQTIHFNLNTNKDFIYYNSVLQKYTIDPGDFQIQVGASSQDIRLKKTIFLE